MSISVVRFSEKNVGEAFRHVVEPDAQIWSVGTSGYAAWVTVAQLLAVHRADGVNTTLSAALTAGLAVASARCQPYKMSVRYPDLM